LVTGVLSRKKRTSLTRCGALRNESDGIGTGRGRRGSSLQEREAPFMKGIILKAATVLLATMGYIVLGIALASAG